jgi:L-ascorbate metabolism protein UlaG (beta-lactamase superfamily)
MTDSQRVARCAWLVATASRLPRARTAVVIVAAAIAVLVTGCGAVPGPRRPDITAFAERLTLPPANDDRSVRVRFGGVSTLLFEVDGASGLMTDGFFSRPGLDTVLTTRIGPDATAICYGLGQMDVEAVPLIVPLHAHYDHAMDAPFVALKTGARLLGDASIRNIARGSRLGEARVDSVTPGKPMIYGEWTLTFIPAEHASTSFRFPGEITQALRPPARVSEWREGQPWTLLVEYASGTTRMKSFLVHASAGYRPGEIARALAGRHVDIVFLGVGGAGHQRSSERERLWTETVRAANASRVILIHWDDLFQGLDQPLRPMSYVTDNFARTLKHFERLAAADGRDVRLPPLFEPFDPYSGLPALRTSCFGSSPGGVRRD